MAAFEGSACRRTRAASSELRPTSRSSITRRSGSRSSPTSSASSMLSPPQSCKPTAASESDDRHRQLGPSRLCAIPIRRNRTAVRQPVDACRVRPAVQARGCARSPRRREPTVARSRGSRLPDRTNRRRAPLCWSALSCSAARQPPASRRADYPSRTVRATPPRRRGMAAPSRCAGGGPTQVSMRSSAGSRRTGDETSISSASGAGAGWAGG
jgi:hypothetical protein